MHYSTFKFALDLQVVQSQVSIPVKFGDTAVRLYITLTDGGVPYTLTEGFLAVLSGVKSDGNKLFNNCMIDLKNSAIVYDFTEQTATSEGITQCEIILYSPDGKVLGTPRFIMLVDNRLVYDANIASTEEREAIDNIIIAAKETQEMLDDAEALRQEAEEARENAVNSYSVAEAQRVEAEALRASAEATRIENETAREEAETMRIENETARANAEAERNSTFDTMMQIPTTVFANALKAESQLGDILYLGDDFSPTSKYMRAKLVRKNLIPFPYSTKTKTQYGVTYTVNDNGSISITGTKTGSTTGTFTLGYSDYLEAGTYTCYLLGATNIQLSVGGSIVANPYTFTVETRKKFQIAIKSTEKGATFDETVYPMLVRGTEAPTSYIPYISSFDGINLYQQSNTTVFFAPSISNFTIAEYSGYENGFIGYKDVKHLKGKTITYTVSTADNMGQGYFKLRLFLYDDSGNELSQVDGNAVSISTPGDTSTIIYTINDNVSYIGFGAATYQEDGMDNNAYNVWLSNQVVVLDDFDKHGIVVDTTIFEVDENGIAENIPCLFPQTILYASSPYVSVCAEYNRDINKAFEELYNAIISLGGNL